MVTAFILIVWHYYADFLFQAESWAINKSKSLKSLFFHVATYSSIWLCVSGSMFSVLEDFSLRESVAAAGIFSTITFVMHFITDYFTSKVTSRMFAEKRLGSSIPNWGAFSVIGLDQVLHYAQLFSTYQLILQIYK